MHRLPLGLAGCLFALAAACSASSEPRIQDAEDSRAQPQPNAAAAADDASAPPLADASAEVDAGDAGKGSDGGLAVDCATRRGGAFVTVRSDGNDNFAQTNVRLWISDPKFIAKAKTVIGVSEPGVPMFQRVIPQRDCDPNFAWHVDPSKASFSDVTIEECDAHGGYVTRNLAAWVARPKPTWCPWGATIVAVEERP